MFPTCATYYNAKEKIWSGPQLRNLYDKNITLGEAILQELNKNPQKVIQISDSSGEQITAGELMQTALHLSKNLRNTGVRKGDVIGLYAHNSNYVPTVMLASWLNGTPVNALYPGFDCETISLIYKSTQPSIIFCDTENYKTAKQAVYDMGSNALIYLLNGELQGVLNVKDLLQCDDTLANLVQNLPCFELSGDDTAVILCSSGTTGTPKGAQCTHRALLNQNVFYTLNSDSVIFTFSTLYWASGIFCLVPSLLHCVLRIVTEKSYSPEYLLDLVDKYKITHMLSNPTQLTELIFNVDSQTITERFSSVDTLLCGGAKVPLLTQNKFNEIMSSNCKLPGFVVAYGMSELSGMLCFSGRYPYAQCVGSEGKLTPNQKVKIIDKLGNQLGPNEHGEIVIGSPYKWSGYFNNPQATKKALIDDWLYTGDLGFFDDEGFLHICARDNDVFKSNNFQIYPQIIEDVILKVPGVVEVCVFGIPDLRLSNLTACAVVRSSDEKGQKLTDMAIIDYVQENMASMYHLTGCVYFVEEIPKTASGKVQRRKMLDVIKNIY